MIFRPELADLVLAGKKTQTRRRMSDNPRSPWFRERCGFQVGEDYAVQDKRGGKAIGRILIEEVKAEPLENITEEDAVAEGFGDIALPDYGGPPVDDFFDYWEELHGIVADLTEIVWALTFRPLGSQR